jgi:RNA polymerase sigma-70 factor (ECF subfamily)
MKAPSVHHSHVVEELVRRHQASVRGFLVYLGCPCALLDDLVQDAFLSVLTSDFERRSDAQTSAYLRSVAKNLLLKALQRERRLPRMADGPELAAAEAAWVEFEADDGGEGYLAALRQCLLGLEQRAREVLGLRYSAGQRLTAIAERLALTESGVKSILVRSRKRLRACIERRLKR